MIDKSKDRPISEVPLSCLNDNERQGILRCHPSQCGWSEDWSPQSNPMSVWQLDQKTHRKTFEENPWGDQHPRYPGLQVNKEC